jgi:hypothetical protein
MQKGSCRKENSGKIIGFSLHFKELARGCQHTYASDTYSIIAI